MPLTAHRRNCEADIAHDLILTKFAIPVLRSNRVVRNRLVQRLDDLERRAVTLVVAPAGYGKTTLLSEWATRSQGAVAWLTLGDSENDLVRFWQYMTAALQRVVPGISDTTLKRLSLMRKPPFETPLHPIISEIGSHPDQVSLFLDDFQEILDPLVQTSFAAFLDLAPSNLRVFIGSRTNPVSTLSRVRRTIVIDEVRTRALAFTRKEAGEFFDRAFSDQVSAEVKDSLLRRTDGWVVGLQIATFGLRESDNPTAFAQSFSGHHRHLLDFFREEVLSGVLPSVRDFILRTSLLNRFNSDLCDALLQRSDSAQVLSELSRSDMFVMPLDESGTWFRYQRLFRDVAIQNLEATNPNEVVELHERATDWLEANGFIEEAATHAVKAGNWDRVVSLIDPIADRLIRTNKVGELQAWIYKVPMSSLAQAPFLSVRLARALMMTNLRADLEPFLVGPERQAREKNDPVLLTAVESLRAHHLVYRGFTSNVRTMCEACLDRLPEDEHLHRGITLRVLGMAELLEDQPQRAEEVFALATAHGIQSGNGFNAAASKALQALAMGRRGLVLDGLALIEEALEISKKHFEVPVAQVPHSHSRLLFDAWRIDEAIGILEEFDGLCDQTGYRIFAAHAQFMLARLKWAAGDPDGVEAHLETARAQTLAFGSAFGLFTPDTLIARMRLAEGKWNSVEIWERAERQNRSGRHSYDRLSLLERVRMWRAINARETKTAEHHIEALRQLGQIARRDGRGADVVDSWVAQATGQFHLGQVDMALCTLTAAVTIAEPGGLRRPFFEEGPRILPLLNEARSRGLHPEFLANIGATSVAPTKEPAVVLSEREVEILRLLSLGYQNHEIADHVVLSENTIKTHLRNVYSKLGTRNRTQAVARGRELHLVP